MQDDTQETDALKRRRIWEEEERRKERIWKKQRNPFGHYIIESLNRSI